MSAIRFVAAFALCLPGLASFSALGQQSGNDLDEVLEQKTDAEERARALKGEADRASREAAALSGKLKQAASLVRQTEARLDALAREEAELNQLIAGLTASIEDRRESLAQSLSALTGISGVPPLAVIARPGEASSIRLAASALAGLKPGLEAEMARLNADRAALGAHRRALATARAAGLRELEKLRERRRELDALASRKRALVRQTRAGAVKAADQARILARRARDLTALMRQLDEIEPVTTAAPARPQLTFRELRGRLAPPAPGPVVSGFGESGGLNSGRGIVLRTRPEALVTAPHDAIVRFAGPFRSYGELLILDFADDYHLLVAGLAGINVAVGQWLLAGEPVGQMGTGEPLLYLELRRKGVPIDPLPWLARAQ